MKPFIPRRACYLLSCTALSIVLANSPARSETRSIAEQEPASSTATAISATPAATWWSPAVEATEPAPVVAGDRAIPESSNIKSGDKNAETLPGEASEISETTSKSEGEIADATETQPLNRESATALPSAEIKTEVTSVSARPFVSTAAGDITPTAAIASSEVKTEEKATPVLAQVARRPTRRPGANFLGIGANVGSDNEDFADLAILTKLKLLDLAVTDNPWSLSVRPSLAFSNGILDLRLPATIEFRQATLTADMGRDRWQPFAGAGAAVSLVKDGDSEFDFMATGGADYVFNSNLTFTGMVNLLFLDDIDAEVQVGVGFNF